MTVPRPGGPLAILTGEPLPIEFANAVFKVRRVPTDGLASPLHLAAWLDDARGRLATPLTEADLLAVDADDLATARALRAAIRALATAAATGAATADGGGAVSDTAPSAAVEVLNAAARGAPRWRELRWGDPPHAEIRSDGRPVTVALTEIAQAAVDLFAGPLRGEIHACGAPNCVKFFIRDHPRREWCGARCGNRARAARHYERVRANSDV